MSSDRISKLLHQIQGQINKAEDFFIKARIEKGKPIFDSRHFGKVVTFEGYRATLLQEHSSKGSNLFFFAIAHEQFPDFVGGTCQLAYPFMKSIITLGGNMKFVNGTIVAAPRGEDFLSKRIRITFDRQGDLHVFESLNPKEQYHSIHDWPALAKFQFGQLQNHEIIISNPTGFSKKGTPIYYGNTIGQLLALGYDFGFDPRNECKLLTARGAIYFDNGTITQLEDEMGIMPRKAVEISKLEEVRKAEKHIREVRSDSHTITF